MHTRQPCDVHRLLQHDHSERDAWDPADKANDCKDGEECKHDAGTPQLSVEIIYRSCNGEDAIQYASQPDEEFGEMSRSQEVSPREDERDA